VLTVAEALYHFARSSPVGAMLGIGLGTVSNRMVVSCEPAGLRSNPFSAGIARRPERRSCGNVTFTLGLSGRAWRNSLQISGGLRLHNFAGENWSTTEVFTSVGFRFGTF
jgi:hypothetical protein